VSGYVTSVPVRDFAQVKAGQVLATIDDRIYAARVEQAKANLAAQLAALANSQQSQRAREAALTGQEAGIANAQAQLVRAEADMKRANALVADGSISERERDQTRRVAGGAGGRPAGIGNAAGRPAGRAFGAGRPGRAGSGGGRAKAQLRLAQVDLDNTVIRAPSDGQLSEIGVRNGAFVTAGTQLMFLVPNDFWIIANFKEAQTSGMRIGQPVTFRVDALNGTKLTGKVENLSPAAGPNSRCSSPTTPPATSSRFPSGSRCASASIRAGAGDPPAAGHVGRGPRGDEALMRAPRSIRCPSRSVRRWQPVPARMSRQRRWRPWWRRRNGGSIPRSPAWSNRRGGRRSGTP
jgi:multidrug resistance efflux pump